MNRTPGTQLFDLLPPGYRVDRRFGAVYETTPSRADDLTLIRGIETREANLLNRMGVYFVPQIALWENQQLCAFSEELGMRFSALVDEQWVEQARMLCFPRPAEPVRESRHLPASFVRTLTLLVCSLMIGCLFVYWLSLRANQPFRGILSAEITAIKVPADSRLVCTHVRAGDEVFYGDKLLTLEKTEHLALIRREEEHVRDLGRRLQQAEAQASLDLEWRAREVERELTDVRARAELIQRISGRQSDGVRSAALGFVPELVPGTQKSDLNTLLVSRAISVPVHTPSRPNSLLFLSGASGESSTGFYQPQVLHIEQPAPTPQVTASVPAPQTSPAVSGVREFTFKPASEAAESTSALEVEARGIELRLQRLEELQRDLPQQVRRAAGVENIRLQHEEAVQNLEKMKELSRDIAVVCPAHGKVGQVRYKTGDTMQAGEILAKILHTDRRFVLVSVPTHRVNEIEPGTVLDLTFPGSQKCQGRVVNLPMLAETSIPGGQTLASVRVEPLGKLWPEIPIGSQIDATIHYERTKL